MSLLRMAVENYRCFKERQEIELRPITVILGRNNSGKSALTRLPLLLRTGLDTMSTLPLDLDLLGDDPPDYLDLVYGRNPHRQLRLEYSVSYEGQGFPKEELDLRATIQNIAEQRTQIVSHLELSREGDTSVWEWQQRLGPGPDDNGYRVTSNGQTLYEGNVKFTGLTPSRGIPGFGDSATEFYYPFSGVVWGFGRVNYLGPYRDRPARLMRLPSKMPTMVGASGQDAPGMLINDFVRRDGLLLEQVNAYLGDNLPGWVLEVDQKGPVFSIELRSTLERHLKVNLLDAGTGVAQMLPLLVQRAEAVLEPGKFGSILEIIEEPELHLHPAAHALLADLFIAGADPEGVRFLIETHSETMLLRLRRRIAEGRISADTVAVYFVEHANGSAQARRIEIDEAGDLVDYWPEGIFSEGYEETRKLAQAQFAQDEI